jgi:hypothetical protein
VTADAERRWLCSGTPPHSADDDARRCAGTTRDCTARLVALHRTALHRAAPCCARLRVLLLHRQGYGAGYHGVCGISTTDAVGLRFWYGA